MSMGGTTVLIKTLANCILERSAVLKTRQSLMLEAIGLQNQNLPTSDL